MAHPAAEKSDDYVLATDETHSVREFVELAFGEIGINLEWKGTGKDEQGLCKKTGRTLVQIDPRYFRPTEVELLLGDSTKARKQLGWKPRRIPRSCPGNGRQRFEGEGNPVRYASKGGLVVTHPRG